jgi:hypothetical protein
MKSFKSVGFRESDYNHGYEGSGNTLIAVIQFEGVYPEFA